ncbi:MAG: hypothetical protein Q9186_001284 [Xanthomendoza sp. 1 TL-2023]
MKCGAATWTEDMLKRRLGFSSKMNVMCAATLWDIRRGISSRQIIFLFPPPLRTPIRSPALDPICLISNTAVLAFYMTGSQLPTASPAKMSSNARDEPGRWLADERSSSRMISISNMAAPSPPTQDSNLRGMTVSSISLITFATGANLVMLRMYVRMKRHVTGWDDYTICVALVLSLLGTVANVYQVANGAGRHIENLTAAQLSEFVKWTFVEGVAFVISTCLIKISVCVFILRFINRTRRTMHNSIYVLMGFLIVSTLGLLIALLAQCRPLKALYVFDIKGKCYSKDVSIAVAYVQSGRYSFFHTKCDIIDDNPAINVFTDFACAGLPFFVIRKLQMKRSLKIGLSIIMGLGVFTASFSALRIAFLHTNYSADVTYDNLINVVTAVLEMNLGIVAASIATLRPLFVNLEPMVRIASDPTRGPNASNQPFVRRLGASMAGAKLRGILLSSMGSTKTTDVDVTQDSRKVSEEQGSSSRESQSAFAAIPV